MKKIFNYLFPSSLEKKNRSYARTFIDKITVFTNSGYLNSININYLSDPDGIVTKHIFDSMFNVVDGKIINPHKLNLKSSTMQYLRYEPENASIYFGMNHTISGKFVMKYSVIELVRMGVIDVPKLMKYVQSYESTKNDKTGPVTSFKSDLIGI